MQGEDGYKPTRAMTERQMQRQRLKNERRIENKKNYWDARRFAVDSFPKAEPITQQRLTTIQRLEQIGEDEILARVVQGESYREIAESLGINKALLWLWLNDQSNHNRYARTQDAMIQSAEAWLDRGLIALLTAASDSDEIQRARHIETHCARRAALRNPWRYSDKLTIEHSGQVKTLREMTDDELLAIIAAKRKLTVEGDDDIEDIEPKALPPPEG